MLNLESFSKLVQASLAQVKKNGPSFYGWVNSPVVVGEKITHTTGWGENEQTTEVSAQNAMDIMAKKLNGAYGERFVMSLGLVSSLIANGYNVRLVQFSAEKGLPFDAAGWTVMVVETMPVFHISPEDLDASLLSDIVEVLDDNQADDVCWKQTDKVGEFTALLSGSIEPGLDLVSLAQQASAD